MTNLITKIAAAAVFAGLLATAAQAQSKKPFEGVVLVAAVPMDEIQPKALREYAKPKFKRGQVVKYSTAMARRLHRRSQQAERSVLRSRQWQSCKIPRRNSPQGF